MRSDILIPPLGADVSTTIEEVHITRTAAGRALSAVWKRVGRRSCVRTQTIR